MDSRPRDEASTAPIGDDDRPRQTPAGVLTRRAALLAGASLFAAGAASGALLRGVLVPRSTPGEVVPVVGNELGNGLERTMPSSSASPKARAKAKAKPEPRPAPAEERLPRPQEIAEEALGFTAFVRGKRVYGAGILVDGQGHVLTCWHVVNGTEGLTVSFADTDPLPARIVDHDEKLDLALLKVDLERNRPLRTASITTMRMGDEVFGMGAPRKMSFSLSRGIVSFVGRPFDGVLYLQTDLPTNGGNSGGPVMNERGEVVAIASFILRDSQGLAFALPIDYAYVRFATVLGAPPRRAEFESWLAARGGKQDGAQQNASPPG